MGTYRVQGYVGAAGTEFLFTEEEMTANPLLREFKKLYETWTNARDVSERQEAKRMMTDWLSQQGASQDLLRKINMATISLNPNIIQEIKALLNNKYQKIQQTTTTTGTTETTGTTTQGYQNLVQSGTLPPSGKDVKHSQSWIDVIKEKLTNKNTLIIMGGIAGAILLAMLISKRRK